MVSWKINRRASVAVRFTIYIVLLVGGLITSGVILGLATKNTSDNEPAGSPEPETTVVDEPHVSVIDFQPVVNDWVNSVSGSSSVLIYDLDNERVIGEYNADELRDTASLYKLFVVYEGYKRLEGGIWNSNEIAGDTGYTISQCLDLAIRESHSPCAETLLEMIGETELEEIIKDYFGITNSRITSFRSTARDIAAILRLFYKHPDINNEAYVSQIMDSFLNQPPTTYDWRQGLPSGFSHANVYNKVGWDYNPAGYWNIYNDAAIIEFPDKNRHFVVVVMANRVPFEKISDFGRSIEEYFNKY